MSGAEFYTIHIYRAISATTATWRVATLIHIIPLNTYNYGRRPGITMGSQIYAVMTEIAGKPTQLGKGNKRLSV